MTVNTHCPKCAGELYRFGDLEYCPACRTGNNPPTVLPPHVPFALPSRRAVSHGISAGQVISIIIGGGIGCAMVLGLLLSATHQRRNSPTVQRAEVEQSHSQIDWIATLSRTDFLPAASLFREYEENEIRSDKNFKGKRIPITGMVESVGTDILGSPYISLESGSLFGVQCMFPRNNKSDLENLNRGDVVFIAGTVSGKFVGVLVRDCRFVTPID